MLIIFHLSLVSSFSAVVYLLFFAVGIHILYSSPQRLITVGDYVNVILALGLPAMFSISHLSFHIFS